LAFAEYGQSSRAVFQEQDGVSYIDFVGYDINNDAFGCDIEHIVALFIKFAQRTYSR
jgi:hypothetical protein